MEIRIRTRPVVSSAVAFVGQAAQPRAVQVRLRHAGALWLALAGLLVPGCASRPRVDWDTRVGSYTFDNAVRELGPPDRSADLSDGGRVAEWLTRRGNPGSPSYAVWPAYRSRRSRSFDPLGPTWVPATPPSPDRFLRLTFGADSNLVAWESVNR